MDDQNLINVNVDVDAITGGSVLLKRFETDNNKLTAVSIISNRKELPESTGTVRYEPIPLDTFIGENCKDWDGHSAMTLYFNRDGGFDHYEKSGTATAGANV